MQWATKTFSSVEQTNKNDIVELNEAKAPADSQFWYMMVHTALIDHISHLISLTVGVCQLCLGSHCLTSCLGVSRALWLTDWWQMIILPATLCSLAEITLSAWLLHTCRRNGGRRGLEMDSRCHSPLEHASIYLKRWALFEFTCLISHTGPCLVQSY